MQILHFWSEVSGVLENKWHPDEQRSKLTGQGEHFGCKTISQALSISQSSVQSIL